MAGPLGDEWAEVRGESLENRLEYVRQCARALETNSSHVGFSLQLLSEQVQISLQQHQHQQQPSLSARSREDFIRDPLRRGETVPYGGTAHARSESRNLLIRPQLHGSQSYTEGEAPPPSNFRKGDLSKVRKILGDDPTPQGAIQQVEEYPFLRLDLEHDLAWDIKTRPPQSKVAPC